MLTKIHVCLKPWICICLYKIKQYYKKHRHFHIFVLSTCVLRTSGFPFYCLWRLGMTLILFSLRWSSNDIGTIVFSYYGRVSKCFVCFVRPHFCIFFNIPSGFSCVHIQMIAKWIMKSILSHGSPLNLCGYQKLKF